MTERLAEAEARERNFLMSVSHELRTPLTAIRGHVAALLEGVVEDPEQRTLSLEVVEAEARRLERLVGDILDLAKLDAHRFTVRREEVDMEQLVEQAYETFSEEARRRSIDYRVDVRDRPVIVSDGDRVLQIVDNLLSNAFRATPDGGRITLELARTNGQIHVAVEDTGPGIAPEKRERLFRAVRLGGRRHGARARDREGALARARRPDRLDSRSAAGSRFELCCRLRLKPRARAGARAASAARRRSQRPTLARWSSARSIRSRRSFIARHWPVIRSTRSARSSTRACRSASRSVSSRSSRRTIWFERPLTSASRREIGAASSRRPSRSALADRVGQHDLELVRGLRERLDLEAGPLERRGDVGRERVAIVHDVRR